MRTMQEERFAHRAVCSPGTHQEAAGELTIDDIAIVFINDGTHLVMNWGSSGMPKKPLIEFHSPDGILVSLYVKWQVLEFDFKTGEVSERIRILLRSDSQRDEDTRSDPSSAGFWTRKVRLVEQEIVHSCQAKLPGAGCAGWSSSNNDYFCVLHVAQLMRQSGWRVPCRVNTICQSC